MTGRDTSFTTTTPYWTPSCVRSVRVVLMTDEDRVSKEQRRLIAVDFDHTLTTGAGPRYWEDPFDEEADTGMVDLVNDLYKRGHIIHVWTARREEVRAETQMWLDRWDVMHHALVMEKHSPDLFVDDKAINERVAKMCGVDWVEERAYE